ncbi:hypothetical protein Leryth_024793 [Lithospermum erythrorhizon]|nr:hypothetical protein Leryth_024793 [Lithospermum erythrorhizon]
MVNYMNLPFLIRNPRGPVIQEDVEFMYNEVYDEYFCMTFHVGGRFEMKPILDYVGARTIDFDWIMF